jgi:hypothetical protein
MPRNVNLKRGTVVIIHQDEISKMTALPNGMVSSWLRKLTDDITKAAAVMTKAETNNRGYPFHMTDRLQLWQGYHTWLEELGPTRSVYHVRNSVSHAKYVFQGTGPIFAKGVAMPVGKSQLGLYGAVHVPKEQVALYRIVYKQQVDGQRARNFPMRAASLVMKRRGM